MSSSLPSYATYTAGVGYLEGSEASTSDFSSRLSYPTSSCRDEPLPGATASHRADPPRESANSSLLPTEYNKYLSQLQQPGDDSLMPGTRVSSQNPLVDAFIAKLAPCPRPKSVEYHKETCHEILDAILPEHTVHGLLGLELNRTVSEAVFYHAALKLSDLFSHPAHFTLWGGRTGAQTAVRVQAIYGAFQILMSHALTD